MTGAFYSKDMFSTDYTKQFDTSSFFGMNENKLQYYPTPEKSPFSNESMMVYQQQQPYLDATMMMVPPLGDYNYFETSYENNLTYMAELEHNAIDIDLVDKFIAEHEAALNFPEIKQQQEQQQQQQKEISWSHWTFIRESSPEILSEGLSSSKSSTNSSLPSSPMPETTVEKLNKVTKPGRRGRGKGIKNKNKKVVEKQVRKAVVEGALFVCQHDNCGKSFTRPYNLTSHMRTHSTERPYACSHCERRFARQHDRNRHEKLHWGIRPYACDHCHKAFARMDALNRHLRMENGCNSMHL